MKTTVEMPDSLFGEVRKMTHRERTTLKVLTVPGINRPKSPDRLSTRIYSLKPEATSSIPK